MPGGRKGGKAPEYSQRRGLGKGLGVLERERLHAYWVFHL